MPQIVTHQFPTTEAAGQISLPALQATLWRGKWQVLAMTLFAVALGGAFLAIVEPTYNVQARLLVEQQGMPLEQVTADPRGNKEFIATQAEVVRSPAVVQRAVDAHGLVVSQTPDVEPAAAILEELQVAPVLGTNVLSVQYTSIDPQEAQRIAAGIIDSYRVYLQELEEDTQLEAVRLLTRSEKDLRDDLTHREKEYLKLREHSPLLGGQGRDAVAVQLSQVTQLAQTLHDVTTRRLELSNLLAAMQQANEIADARPEDDVQFVALRAADTGAAPVVKPASLTTPGLIPRFTQEDVPPDLVAIQQELAKSRSHFEQLSAEYGAKHPAVQSAQAQAAAWNDRLAEYLKSAPEALKQELAALARQQEQLQELYDSQLTKAKSVDSYLIREQQALDGITRVQTMHSSLLAQLQQWQLSEQASAGGHSRITFRVLEEPVAPDEPTWPAPKLVLAVSLMMGLCAGLALAFFRSTGSLIVVQNKPL
jgi:uncharacterized protein involved in exopolysaccharide biosynthesis